MTDTPDQPEKLPFFPRRKKFLIPIILLLSAVVFGLGIGLLFAFNSHKRSAPYKLTLQTLEARPEVKQHVGLPFEEGFIVLGDVDEDAGMADMMLKIKGPVGQGAVRSRAELQDGQWVIVYLDMGVGDREHGEVITMIGDPDALPQ